VTWRLQVVHRSGYDYAAPVIASYNEARMTPLTDLHQATVSSHLSVEPTPTAMLRYWDYWGSQVTAFDMQRAHQRLSITAESTVETERPATPAVIDWAGLQPDPVRDELAEFLSPTRYTTADEDLHQQARVEAGSAEPVEAALSLCRWVHEAMRYQQGVTAVHTSALEALSSGMGVCQDYAHAAIAMLRALDIPARYVSGYFHPDPAPRVGDSATGQSHAWVEIWTGAWWGYDPTNDLPIGEQHVTVGRGRDYSDVPPLRGIYSGGASTALDVTVDLTRLR
jgi:transglutaminase-like putative cysteine protease